jgi:hypothetical protein
LTAIRPDRIVEEETLLAISAWVLSAGRSSRSN